VITVYRY